MNTTPPVNADTPPIRPPRGAVHRVAVASAAALVVIGVATGGWMWSQHRQAASQAPVAVGPAAVASTAPASAAPLPATPVIQHPIERLASAAPSSEALPLLDQADAVVTRGLTELLGTGPAMRMLQLDGFVRRVVATVDNLDRAHASARLWPVLPIEGRFTVQRDGNAEFIAPANSTRYAAFVRLVESVDTARAAALYVKLYPLFQQAYQDLGYPQGYFNDRLVEVIDRLLATPEPAGPIAVRLTDVKGPIASQRPWVRYEFVDPALQALPAGSKMLLRMGPDNERRLKATLVQWRSAITGERAGAGAVSAPRRP